MNGWVVCSKSILERGGSFHFNPQSQFNRYMTLVGTMYCIRKQYGTTMIRSDYCSSS